MAVANFGKHKDNVLSYDEAHQRYAYNPATGALTWKVSVVGIKIGSPAGTSTDHRGYRAVKVREKKVYVHRLAFLMMTGKWPQYEVDHINGNKADNSWDNLRDVPAAINQRNKTLRKRKQVMVATATDRLPLHPDCKQALPPPATCLQAGGDDPSPSPSAPSFSAF